jgi:predicted deacylase
MSAKYPVELVPPDISAYRQGNTGIDYVTTFDSGRPGPHVMIAAVTHGNELCGAVVVDFLFRQKVRPTAGKLTLAFNNYRAYLTFDARYPGLSRYIDEDFNRLWSPDVLDGGRTSDELRRAREMRPLIDSVDLLLDLHSMQTRAPALMLSGPLEKGRLMAAAVGVPEFVVSDIGHAAGMRMRDYGAFGDPASNKNALLVECGQHWEQSSADVAMQTTLRFLKHCGIVDRAFLDAHISGNPPPQKFVTVTGPVTIKHDDFQFVDEYQGMEVIAKAGTIIAHDGDEPVRTPYDDCVLIMPSRRMSAGQTAVRLGRFTHRAA